MQSRYNGHRGDLTGDEELHEAARSGQHRQGPLDEQIEERAAPGDESAAAEEAMPPSEPPDDERRRLERERLDRELDGE